MGTTADLQAYYQNLLILQYATAPKARGMVSAVVTPAIMPQTGVLLAVASAAVPNGGSWTLTYNGQTTAAIAWNASLAAVQTALQAVYPACTVAATSYASALVNGTSFTLTGVNVLTAPLPTVNMASVTTTSVGVSPSCTASLALLDPPLPLAVRDAFNLAAASDTLAFGAQLDALAKYIGVTRTGPGLNGAQITLSDADFLTLMRLATAQNYLTSDLASVQAFIQTWFPGQMLVFDYQSMQMSFLISSAIGSQNLIQRYAASGLLPRPMGVGASVVYAPSITTFFGCRTYWAAAYNVTPLNTYSSYQTSRPWVSYAQGVTVPATT